MQIPPTSKEEKHINTLMYILGALLVVWLIFYYCNQHSKLFNSKYNNVNIINSSYSSNICLTNIYFSNMSTTISDDYKHSITISNLYSIIIKPNDNKYIIINNEKYIQKDEYEEGESVVINYYLYKGIIIKKQDGEYIIMYTTYSNSQLYLISLPKNFILTPVQLHNK